MSDPCPTCGEQQQTTGAAHSLLVPRVNPDVGSPAPKELGPCDESESTNTALCNDGYRIPIVTAQSVAPEICSNWDVTTPCADRWAYPGLLVEVYPLGFAEVVIAKADIVTLKNLTIQADSIIAQGLTLRPIPKTPASLQGIPDSEVQDPAKYESSILSQNIRFLVAEYVERCGTFWKPTARKGMCGLPLTTSVGVTSLLVPLWNPTTGCFHFLPMEDEGDALVIKDGIPQWYSTTQSKQIFVYSGAQQIVTVPADGTSCEIKCWGAGGSWDAGVSGGCGGYTRVKMPIGLAASAAAIKQGDKLSVIVGQGQHNLVGPVFGFGGSGQGPTAQQNGGGLSGVFTGEAAVLKGDYGRAIVIAGGGGAAGKFPGGPNLPGGNGNTQNGATMPDMQGNNATGTSASGTGGGGGGFRGGTYVAGYFGDGYGGSGFAHAEATEQELLWLGQVIAVDPPKITDPDYVSGVGRQGQPGRVVIQFFGAS